MPVVALKCCHMQLSCQRVNRVNWTARLSVPFHFPCLMQCSCVRDKEWMQTISSRARGHVVPGRTRTETRFPSWLWNKVPASRPPPSVSLRKILHPAGKAHPPGSMVRSHRGAPDNWILKFFSILARDQGTPWPKSIFLWSRINKGEVQRTRGNGYWCDVRHPEREQQAWESGCQRMHLHSPQRLPIRPCHSRIWLLQLEVLHHEATALMFQSLKKLLQRS